jgi:exonuclease III
LSALEDRIAGAIAGAVVAAALFAACGSDPPGASGPVGRVSLGQYNIAQCGPDTCGAAAAWMAGAAPDFLTLQECASCDWLIAGLAGGGYALSAPARAGIALAYDSSRWALDDAGDVLLGDDDDGWGERVARWGRFLDRSTGAALVVYSTHFCVPIRSPDDDCTEARQLDYAAALVDDLGGRTADGEPAVVGGDLNVFDGFEDGRVIAYLVEARGLIDLYRQLHPDGEAITFEGNSWAPPGRLDYVFATAPVDVLAARIDSDADGSDHSPVFVVVGY